MTFQERLKAACAGGNLRVADLARWFERSDPTVRGWVERGHAPADAPIDRNDIERRLKALEGLIRKKDGFPVPRMSAQKRIKHIARFQKKVL